MSFQRAAKMALDNWRAIDAERRMDDQANPDNEIVSSVGGFWIVRQGDGSGYTLQRGYRVRFAEDGKPWPSREAAEEAAEDAARKLADRRRGG